MPAPFDNIVQHLFHQPSLQSVTVEELERMTTQHPYFAAGHFLLLKKMQDSTHPLFTSQLHKTTLYFNNPLWLQFLLQPENVENLTVLEKSPFLTNEQVTETAETNNDNHSADDKVNAAEINDAHIKDEQYDSDLQTLPVVQDNMMDVITQVFREPDFYLDPVTALTAEIAPSLPEEVHAAKDAHMADPATDMPESIIQEPETQFSSTAMPAEENAQMPSGVDSFAEPDAVMMTAPVTNTDESPAKTAKPIDEPARNGVQPYEHNTAEHESATGTGYADATADHDNTELAATHDDDEHLPAAPLAAVPVEEQPALESVTEPDAVLLSAPVAHTDEARAETVSSSDEPRLGGIQPDGINSVEHASVTGSDQADAVADHDNTELPANNDNEHLTATPVASFPVEQQPLFKTIIETPGAKNDLLFEPYHTVDYFASQGIKLGKFDVDAKDKLGRQLRSFTDWLKTMKKLPQVSIDKLLAENEESKVVEDANHSIETKEVVTETMAEVFEMQGMHEKAAEIYRKLSLLNPAKSAYFAAKLEALKPL